jgi:Rrf2 family transcriptional regulator, iron-sulfur cluster assembly transcription factor
MGMPLLSRKGILAIAAVIDVALNSDVRPVSAKALASRHGLPPRHLEPVLQALVHEGILKGVRGPRGGYALGRHQDEITADDILRAAVTTDESFGGSQQSSPLVATVVVPALAQAERAFASTLGAIKLDDLIKRAEMVAPT